MLAPVPAAAVPNHDADFTGDTGRPGPDLAVAGYSSGVSISTLTPWPGMRWSRKRPPAAISAYPFERVLLAFFLVSVSQGEGLGAAAVGMIGQQELARRIHDLERQEREERGHERQTLEAARQLFPELFVDGRYRYEKSLEGQPYYLSVLEANRARLERRGRFSRLNQYLTTTFGYEIMVVLLYRAVADAVAGSELPVRVRTRVVEVLERILAEEETHLGVLEQHNALLETPREGLSDEARRLLERLATLDDDDYAFVAELSVRRVVEMMRGYADPDGYRARILGGSTQAA